MTPIAKDIVCGDSNPWMISMECHDKYSSLIEGAWMNEDKTV